MNAYRNSAVAAVLLMVSMVVLVGAQQTPGTWKNVSPSADVAAGFSGTLTVLTDPVKKNNCWFAAADRGVWRSTDYGMTWTKANTGTNADKIDQGRPWYAASDMNPNRDPSTSPTIYITEGYGSGCVWKSTDGGVNWTNVWNNNIYAPDGVTDISKDVGGDISAVVMPDISDKNHVLVSLHSYWGTGNNNGVFETTDGGGKWIVHLSATFNFQPHSDILFAYDKNTWMVTHGTSWPSAEIFRTTDGAASWTIDASTVSVNTCRAYWIVGSTMWGGSDYTGGLFKSTDKGLTWKQLSTPNGNAFTWVCATATTLYASTGASGSAAHIYHAPLTNDATLVDGGNPDPGMVNGASTPGVTFDGTHYIIIACQAASGVWRYVEPATSSRVDNANSANTLRAEAINHLGSRPAGSFDLSGRFLRQPSRGESMPNVLITVDAEGGLHRTLVQH
jgi:photosystem II stability/assembly factor-like uncharacterized protein